VASVTSDKDEECDNEYIQFTVTTNTPGYESLISWRYIGDRIRDNLYNKMEYWWYEDCNGHLLHKQ